MEDAHVAYSTRRYVFVAVFVAMLAILATVLLTALVSAMEGNDVTHARVDSPRVHGREGYPEGRRHLTLAIAPVLAPTGYDSAWADLAELLEAKLDVEITLVHRRTYRELDQLLEGPDAAIALICAGPYVRLRRRGAIRMLAAPRVRGADVYRSYIVVRADSDARTIEDLRGGSFAFSDPLSNSGALYPRFLLSELGTTPEELFARTTYTHGHDRSIRAVANGLIDGAAVDSLVFDTLAAAEPALTRQLRIIHTSPPFGMNPLVANQRTPPELFDALRAALLTLHEDERGRAVLSELAIDQLVPGTPADYRSIEAMLQTVEP